MGLSRPGPAWRIAAIIGVATLGATVVTVRGQDVPPDAGQDPAVEAAQSDGLRADERQPDVYINESLEAADSVTRAQALAARDRWSEAARLLQETADRFSDKCIRVVPGRYAGVRRYVQEVIAGWPAAGLAAYRSLYESAAAVPDSSARDLPTLLDRFEHYFCTAAAAELGDRIGQLAIESADFPLARRVYEDLRDRHPDRAALAPRCTAMLAVIDAMQGGAGLLPPDAESVSLRWMGGHRSAAEVITEIAGRFDPPPAQRPEDWPLFGGNTARNRYSESVVDKPGLLWRTQPFTAAAADAEPERDEEVRRRVEPWHQLSMQPVTHGDRVFVQFGRQVAALDRAGGEVLWRFDGTPAGETDAEAEDRPPRWQSVTVADGRVYAALTRETDSFYGYPPVEDDSELVCLEESTGRMLWRVNRARYGDALHEIAFDSSLVADNGRLYVVARRRRSFGFEDCYLYALNARDGQILYRTHLGSASTGSFGTRRPTMAMPTLRGDTVYVCTNLGTVAAVSAHTGRVLWLNLYERLREGSDAASTLARRPFRPWRYNPVIWHDGRLYALPVDAGSVLVYEARDGRQVAAAPISELGRMDALLGVREGLLCGVGSEVVCYDTGTSAVRWRAPLDEEAGPLGRGVWTDEQIVIPMRDGLASFAMADGARTDLTWDAAETGGNLLALPEGLLVAGRGSVSLYVRKDELWARLHGKMEEAPGDPTPALDLAEVAFRSGDFQDALEALAEADRRAAAADPEPDEATRRRLFEDVLSFAQGLFERSQLSLESMDQLYEAASRWAPDPAGHVAYRLQVGEIFQTFGQPQRALLAYQQVLRDRTLRELSSRPGTPGAPLAGALAAGRIDALLAEHGRTLYDPFEREANGMLNGAVLARDPNALLRVAETFPNAHAAPQALLALGDLLVEQGKPLEAARRLTAAYHRYLSLVDRPALVRKIADAYVAAGRRGQAWRWLTKGARQYPDALLEQGGRRVTFADYRAKLSDVAAAVQPRRPALSLPLENLFAVSFTDAAELLTPRFAEHPKTDWSRYYVYAQGGVMAYVAGGTKECWAQPAAVRLPPELLIAGEKRTVLVTEHELFALDVVTGTRQWTAFGNPRELDDPQRDWEGLAAIRSVAVYGGRALCVQDDGTVSCVDLSDGRLVWQVRPPLAPAGPVELSDEYAAYIHVRNDRNVVCLLDADSGAWQDAIETDEERPADDVLITLDGQVLMLTSQTITAFDPETRRQRWRVTTSGHLRRSAVVLDIDALFFVGVGGRTIEKFALDDGTRLWRWEASRRGADEAVSLMQLGTNLFLTTATAVSAVDALSGVTLWEGVTPADASFTNSFITEAYVGAVSQPEDGEAAVYFYDHRNASGRVPAEGGVRSLGRLENVRAILATDGALLIQTGNAVQGWGAE